MGSAPSTSSLVSQTDSEQEKVVNTEEEDEREKELETRVIELEGELSVSEQRCLEAEAQCSRTSDELEMLREELERVNKQLADSRARSASERATQQLVRRLKSELSAVKQELVDMKSHHEQEMKRTCASSAKSQAESALTVFELRDENHRLTQENKRLLEHVSWCQQEHDAPFPEQRETTAFSGPPNSSSSPSSRYNLLQSHSSQLVIELSEQVASLSGELEQAKLTINKLRQGNP